MFNDFQTDFGKTPLVDVPGIGGVRAQKIASAGIESAEDLAEADPDDVQEAAGCEDWRAEQWVNDAGEIIPDEDDDNTAKRSSEGRASARAGDAVSGSDDPPAPEGEDEFERLWGRLSVNQKKVAQEFLFTSSKAEAAREVGLSPTTVYSWPDYVWDASEMLVDRRAGGISEGMSALSPQAIEVLRRALDPDRDVSRVEAESAQYLLNQLEGKPTQKSEVEVEGGIDVSESDRDALDDALSHLGDE
jgi:molybdenum-dependent DNA-binding transcriptional regulator ModE